MARYDKTYIAGVVKLQGIGPAGRAHKVNTGNGPANKADIVTELKL